jgi:hypothetical protein
MPAVPKTNRLKRGDPTQPAEFCALPARSQKTNNVTLPPTESNQAKEVFLLRGVLELLTADTGLNHRPLIWHGENGYSILVVCIFRGP